MLRSDYLLDTHILIWALENTQKLNKNVKEDIEYFQCPFYVSVASLHEIIFLIQEIPLLQGGVAVVRSETDGVVKKTRTKTLLEFQFSINFLC